MACAVRRASRSGCGSSSASRSFVRTSCPTSTGRVIIRPSTRNARLSSVRARICPVTDTGSPSAWATAVTVRTGRISAGGGGCLLQAARRARPRMAIAAAFDLVADFMLRHSRRCGSRSLTPAQEDSDIAGHAAGKIEDARPKMKALLLQVFLPAQIELRRLAAQRRRPLRFAHVDRTSAIAADLAGETQQHELLLAVLGRQARLVDEIAPAHVRDMAVDPLRGFSFALLCRGAALLISMQHFLLVMIGDQPVKIRDSHARLVRSRGWTGTRLTPAMHMLELPIDGREHVRQGTRLRFCALARLLLRKRAQ